MQMTYEELAIAISKMSDAEKKRPVKMYTGAAGDMFPRDECIHPDVSWSSRLVLEKELDVSDPDYINPNQYIIEEYMDEESDQKCNELLEWKRRNRKVD